MASHSVPGSWVAPATPTPRWDESQHTASQHGDAPGPMAITAAAHALAVKLGTRGVVQSRGPVAGLGDTLDVAVLVPRADGYRGAQAAPRGDRVLLGLMVAEADGPGVTLRALGAAGIEELWVVDLSTRSLHVHRGADVTGYGETRFLGPEEPLSPLAWPDLIFRGADFLGEGPGLG